MLRVHFSNCLEALLQGLVQQLDGRDEFDPLKSTHLVVPNRNMERYVELGVAQALGVAANLSMHRLERFVRQWLEQALPAHRILDRPALETQLLSALVDEALIAAPALRPVARYLAGAGQDADAVDLRRVQLAMRVAGLFEEYTFSRPELLDAWAQGRAVLQGSRHAETEVWQRALWQHIRQPPAGASVQWLALHEALRRVEASDGAPGCTEPVHVFGVSYVARVFQWAFAVLGGAVELHLYTLNPCMEFWEDVPSAAELHPAVRLASRRDRVPASHLAEQEHHPHVGQPATTPALVMWGRPGREHVHSLNDLTGCDFDARFRDPVEERGASLLTSLQRDILRLEPERSEPDPACDLQDDDSIRVLACPGVRREVEAIADEIWTLIRRDAQQGGGSDGEPPLRFNDIAVLVTGTERELYLPHIEAVFREAWDIPHNVVDLPLASGSRIAEAAELLLDLPFTRFTRADVLDVVTHPAVRGRVSEVDPNDWIVTIDRLGVFHGVDQEEHRNTYIERDIHNWDQGIRRLVLGAFMTGESSGDERSYDLGGERYLPEEGRGGATAELGLLVRSLANDVCFARSARLRTDEWSEFFAGLFQGYLTATDDAEHGDLRRCLAAVQSLSDHDLGEQRVSYRIAAELVRRSIRELGGARGEYLADGVVVSTLVPMRAIPFRAVFVAGLGEGRFPAAERRDTMDLRTARRRTGDVSPAERDENTFLETVLSAREHLYLSYVARDELTGDGIDPSAVVRQLLDVIRRGYLPDAPSRLVTQVPLRRYEPDGERDAPCTVLPEAHAEARARRLGRALRSQIEEGSDEAVSLGHAEQLARVQRALGEQWEPVRELLRLCPIPSVEPTVEPVEDVPEPEAATVRVSLSTVRRFVESPLQGWAQAVVGIEEDELQAPEAREEEPLGVPPMEGTMALRHAFVEATRGGGTLEERYRDAVERLEARGRWPTGVLRELRGRDDLAVLACWQTQLDRIARWGGPSRPERLRFGPGLEHGDADTLLEPIVLEMPDPRPGSRGRPLRVELTGRTQPLLWRPGGSLILVPRAGRDPERQRTDRLRYALRGFIDHVALAAAGVRDAGNHAAFVLYGQEATEPPGLPFAALAADRARDWLQQRVAELLGEVHAYNLPCEALLRKADHWEGLSAGELAESIQTVLAQWGGGQSRFGPVPQAERYPPPDADRALEMARARFSLFFELVSHG